MKSVTFTVEEHIAIVTLNRPPINALVKDTYLEIQQVFSSLDSIPEVRVAILRAETRFFCPGNEVHEFLGLNTAEDARAYAQIVSDSIASIYNCGVPVIAAVHGHAIGAGMAIAACADVLITSEEAQFSIPEIRVGVIGASGFLALLVPEKVVRYMSLTGNPISAQEVKAYGGAHQVVPTTDVLSTAMEVAQDMCQRGPTALRYFKEAMNINQNARLVEKYATEASYTERYVGTPECNEAVAAFVEKRPPVHD